MSKRPSLSGGLIQRKGEAPRPPDIPPVPTPAPTAPAAPDRAPVPAPTAGRVPLTVKLSSPDYERLRAFAFQNRRSHQDIIEKALLAYLDSEGA